MTKTTPPKDIRNSGACLKHINNQHPKWCTDGGAYFRRFRFGSIPYSYLQTPWRPGNGPPPSKGTCPFRHLEDLEVGPTPKCDPRQILKMNRGIKNQRTPPNQNSTSVVPCCFHNFFISLGRYAHSGIRVLQKTTKNDKLEMGCISQK